MESQGPSKLAAGWERETALFSQFLSRCGKKKLAIATHSRADADGLSAAYALSKMLPGSVICSSEEPGEGAAMLAQMLGMELKQLGGLHKKDFDGLVVVDTSAYTLLPEAKGWKLLLIIDHHRADGRDMKAEFEIIDERSPSTAEIMANITQDIGKDAAFGLAVGIISDAARFKSARACTFATLARLMERWQLDYGELLGYAEPEPREEEKIAMLKAMQRVQFSYAAGYIIATSEVGSNESDAASVLTEAADVAFVAKWKAEGGETRISARARKHVKVPLNRVLAAVAAELGGAGGGHPKAAGAALKEHTAEALKSCVETFIREAEGMA
jgi:nanoRNase/pAp phosphatase (c-di-AMP/oligoRNAs hydrolase)